MILVAAAFVFAAAPCLADCVPPPSGIVAWWPGDANANDIIGTNHGTLQNGVSFSTGKVGQAFSLDGVDDYVDIGQLPELSAAQGMTVMAWVRTHSDKPCNAIVGKWNTLPTSNPNTFLFNPGGILLQFDNRAIAEVGASCPPSGQWAHVAAVWRSSDGFIGFYTNGVLASSGSGGQGRTLFSHVAYTAKIGEWGVIRDASYKFKGDIDEVAVFSRGLSSNEIADIYTASSAGKCKYSVPSALSGLALWQDAGSLSLPDGGNVSLWPGSGGLAFGASQPNGLRQPTFLANAINGRPAINFSGGLAGQSLRVMANITNQAKYEDLSIGSAGITYFAVVRATHPTEGVLFGDNNAIGDFELSRTNITLGRHLFGGRVKVPGDYTRFVRVAGTFSNMNSHATNETTVYVNGVASPTTSQTNSADVVAHLPLNIGEDLTGNSSRPHFGGDLAELIIYNRRLNATELRQIDAYLQNKYPATDPQCVPPPAGLVGWWPGDANANDIVGTNHGTLENGAAFAAGQVGSAFEFHAATSAHVLVPNSPALNPTKITVGAWVKPTSYPPGYVEILRKGPTENGQYVLYLRDGLPYFASFAEALNGPGRLPSNSWSHLVGTYDGTTFRLFVNGVQADSVQAAGSIPTGSGTMAIGRGFEGFVDEVFIANRALSANEIAAISTAHSSGMCQPPAPNLVWISPGTFAMGSATDEPASPSNETPQHSVTLTRGFWMNKYEVTQSDFQSLMGFNPSRFTNNLQNPVEQVNWYEAASYCSRLTDAERAAGRLPSGYAYRLPTEAEWEYACRAGTTTRFSFGDNSAELGNYGWFIGNSGCQYTNDPTCATTGSTQPVGQKLPNPWGLYDVHGNVGEWVLDWSGNYSGGAVTDPSGPSVGTNKLFRAPAWDFGDIYTGSATRWQYPLATRDNSVGLRVVLAPSDVFYSMGFEGPVGPEWSTINVSTTPVGARKFLGEFGNQTVRLTLTNPPPHTVARVSFDLFVIRSWDGNTIPNGPDVWSWAVVTPGGSSLLLRSTFNNTAGSQSYPGTYTPGQTPSNNPPYTGATESRTLGYSFSGSLQDSVYQLAGRFAHTNVTLQLDFSAAGLGALTDESWGLDNVVVELFNVGINELASLAFVPVSPLYPGNPTATRVTLLANFPNVTNVDVTDIASWSSRDTNVFTVNAAGQLLARNVGAASLIATYLNQSATSTVSVLAPVALRLTVPTTLYLGGLPANAPLLADFPGVSNVNVTAFGGATRSSSDPTVATINPNGTITALKSGTVTFSGTYAGLTNEVQVVVSFVPGFNLSLVAYEGFDYQTTSDLSDQGGGYGWTNAWTDVAGDTVIASGTNGSLAYTDALGNALLTSGNSFFYSASSLASGDFSLTFRDLPALRGADNTTTWISVLGQRLGPTTNLTSNPYPRGATPISLYNGATEMLGVGNSSGAPSNTWALIPTGTFGNIRSSSNSFSQLSLVVVRINHKPGNDDAYLFVNPTLGSEPGPSNAVAQSIGSFDFSFNRIRPYVGGNDTANGRPYAELQLDEIRIGDTYAAVTPFVSGVPSFIQHPTNLVVIMGGTASLLAEARGVPPLGYHWLKDGIPLLGATNATLILTRVSTNAAGNYTVVVSNTHGSVTSAPPAVLTVLPLTWEFAGTPGLGLGVGLSDVWARNANDAYALGGKRRSARVDIPDSYLYRWNGTAWSLAHTFPGHYPGRVIGTGSNELWVTLSRCMLGPLQGCGADRGGKIYRSVDGGTNWAEQILPAEMTNREFRTLSGTANNVQAVAEGGIILRFDGLAWSTVFNDPVELVNAHTVLGANEGYYVTCWGWGFWDGNAWSFRGRQFDFCEVAATWAQRDGAGALHWYAVGANNFANGVRVWKFDAASQSFGGKNNFVFSDGSDLEPGAATGVWGSAPDDVYVIGSLAVAPGGARSGRIYYYDGSLWTQVREFGELPPLTGIHGTARDDVWIALSDGRLLHRGSKVRTNDPPVITTPPADQAVVVNRTATFAVAAKGTPPLRYQWWFNGVGIASATNPVLTLPAVQLSNAGSYVVTVSNGFGAVTSAPVNLLVIVPPSFTVQPLSTNVTVNTSITLSVTVSGATEYQWRKNGANIAGATNASFTIPNVQFTNGGTYTVVVANDAGAITSDRAEVIVTPNEPPTSADMFTNRLSLSLVLTGGPPVIVSGFNDKATKEAGEPLHANRIGGRSVWYSWQPPANGIARFNTDGSTFDTVLAVYTGSQLTNLTEIAANDDDASNDATLATNRFFASEVRFNALAGTNYLIAVDAFGGEGGYYVLLGQLEVTSQTLPRITAQPQSQVERFGSNITFSVTATGANLGYQWYFNGPAIAGATAATLTRSSIGAAHVGTYSVRVSNTNTGRYADSQRAVLEISSDPEQGIVLQDKVDRLVRTTALPRPAVLAREVTTSHGDYVGTFSVAAGTVGYHLGNNTEGGTDLSEINHAGLIGGASLHLSFVTTNAGTLMVDTRGSAIDTLSAVYRDTPLLFFEPDLLGFATNSATASNFNSVAVPSGAGGGKFVVVADGVRDARGAIQLNWYFGTPPLSNLSTNAALVQRLSAGDSLTLRLTDPAVTNAAPKPLYRWYRDDQFLAETTEPFLVLNQADLTKSGTYRVVSQNELGTATSFVARLLINQPLNLTQGSAKYQAGVFEFSLTGTEGDSVVVQATANLNRWEDLSVEHLTGYERTFRDREAGAFPGRYYRVVREGSYAHLASTLAMTREGWFPSAGYRFTLPPSIEVPIIVEASSNLQAWFSLRTNPLNAATTVFTDAAATNTPQRYYRLRLTR